MAQQPYQTATGAAIPNGSQTAGTFKPVTFRSGTGTSTFDSEGGTDTQLNAPYAGLSGLVGQGTGLLGQAAQQAQQAPSQFSYNVDPNQRAQDLYSQRSALLDPQFAQQRAQGTESMFGAGRLGLRLAGEGVGAGNGMVQPDAFGMNQAQAQALAQTAASSSNDAFGESMQLAGLQAGQFGMNQQQQQQQYANLMGSAQGMLGAGMQGSALEQQLAQQGQQFGFNQQNYGLAQQQQMQDYALNQQKMALAKQQQFQDYGVGQQQYGLQRATVDQNYELGTEQNRISAITGMAQANAANYQPDPWLTGAVGAGTAFLGSEAGSGWLSKLFGGN